MFGMTRWGQFTVGEYGVFEDGLHGDRVGSIGCTGGHAEETIFRIDGPELALVIPTEPCNVVTDTGDVIALEGGLKHGQIGLSAG